MHRVREAQWYDAMSEARTPTNHIKRAATIWLILTVVAVLVYVFIAPQLTSWGVLPPIGADRLKEVNSVLWLFTLLAIPVFMMVIVFASYAVFNFRSHGRPDSDGPLMRGHRDLQKTWVISSIVLVAFLFGYGLYFLGEVQASPSGQVLHVNVTGEQWLWDYSYPDNGNVTSTELVLPVHTTVEFAITSVDVQHSFWIPSFGVKQDAVPGETVKVTVTPSQIGDYVVRCAELCGLYHAYMETPVHVVAPTDFETWVSQQQTVPTATPAQSYTGPAELAAINPTTNRRGQSALGSVGAA